MKKLLLMTMMVIMIMTLIACGSQSTDTASDAPEVQFITAEEAHEKAQDPNYQLLDVRKLEDFQASHIPNSIHADMDAANKQGDIEDGKVQMQNAGVPELDKNLILVCYSGKSYAEAATKVLGELGYDASKIYTLEGGFQKWVEVYPEEQTQ